MRRIAVITFAAAFSLHPQTPSRDPARLLSDPQSLSQPNLLPLALGETAAVFLGVPGESNFNLHSYVAHHGGLFWVVWSSSRDREEDPDQMIRYATSRDGIRWTAPRVLAADPDGPGNPARWIARGVFVDKGKLRALGACIESADYSRRGQDVVWKNLRLVLFEWTGSEWKERGTFASDCMNNFPPQRLGGVYAMPCRDSRMNVFMALSAQPEGNNWTRTPLSADPPFHRMDEPTLYETADGFTHMILRDNNRSRRLIRALSRDHGRTWSAPVLTDYPDATSKNFTGRLSSGTYFLINNPDTARRDPLVISFSLDGWQFSNPVAIRRGAPPRRPQTSGQGSFQYPHAIEQAGSLWVVYSTNKQDIEITRLPLAKLEGR